MYKSSICDTKPAISLKRSKNGDKRRPTSAYAQTGSRNKAETT